MSKKPLPDMDELYQLKTKKRTNDIQTTDKRLTTDAQPTDSVGTTDAREGETPRRQIRISDSDWRRLTQDAKARGISTSALVRQILREWLRNETR